MTCKIEIFYKRNWNIWNAGTIPGAGGTQRLTRAIGKSRWFTTAKIFCMSVFDSVKLIRIQNVIDSVNLIHPCCLVWSQWPLFKSGVNKLWKAWYFTIDLLSLFNRVETEIAVNDWWNSIFVLPRILEAISQLLQLCNVCLAFFYLKLA